jgi:hypothetical protein
MERLYLHIVFVFLTIFACQTSTQPTARPQTSPNRHEYNFVGQHDLTKAPGNEGELIRFNLPAKGIRYAFLTGDFAEWNPEAFPMTREGDFYSVSISLPSGQSYKYKFVTDIGWIFDPNNPEKQDDTYSGFNSILHLDEEGEVLPHTEIRFFDRKSSNSFADLYTSTESFPNEPAVDSILERTERIAQRIMSILDIPAPTERIAIYFRREAGKNASGLIVGTDIFLTAGSFNYNLIAHEMVHLLSPGGFSFFGSEGFAEALSQNLDLSFVREYPQWYHTEVKGFGNLGELVSFKDIIEKEDFILQENVHQLYTQSASAFLFLMENHEPKIVQQYSQTGNPALIGYSSLEEFEEDYVDFIGQRLIPATP